MIKKKITIDIVYLIFYNLCFIYLILQTRDITYLTLYLVGNLIIYYLLLNRYYKYNESVNEMYEEIKKNIKK